MAVAMKLSDELVKDANTVAAAEHRSVPTQIEYWARIGKAVLDNPDLPLRMIQDTMLSIGEVKAGWVSFDRLVKKLHSKDKKVLDGAVMAVATDPFIGEEKRGDLAGVFVHKFKLNKQETPLAYQMKPDRKKPNEIVLLSVGPHENFYAQLERAK